MSYLGAKNNAGLYQAIIALMPPHEVYIEPFFGSGAIFHRKPRSKLSIINDLNISILDAADYARSQEVLVLHEDALHLLDNYNYAAPTLTYLDPPYVHSTRTSKHRYDFEMTDADHVRLLDIIKSKPGKFILSGYPSELYASMLQEWNHRDFQAMTRGGVRTERVWFNFEPGKPFCANYAGKDFTDRQRIKRKAERWAADFKTMNEAEQLVILNAMLY
jgi:DNA adenine methylase